MDEQYGLRVWASRLGFLADAYDLFAIDLVVVIFEYIYSEEVFDAPAKSLSVSAMIGGVIVGQLSFGFVADWIGRRWAFVVTAGLTVFGALACAAATDTKPFGISLPAQLAFFRFILGLGVGGEYPLSATVAAESTEDPYLRRHNLASVISMQGFGMLLSSLVALTAIWLKVSLQSMWRIILAFGALPSFVAFLLRWQLHESSIYVHAIADKPSSSMLANDGVATQVDGVLSTVIQLWRPLVGTAAPWFLMNCFWYSISSFKSSLLNDFYPTAGSSVDERLLLLAIFSAVTSVFAILGFGAALWLINSKMVTLCELQINGFMILAAVFGLQGFRLLFLEHFRPQASFMLMLGMMFFFQNCGPNVSTFIVPAEAFPTLIRATCHGISAASGKMGAVLGTAFFTPAKEAFGLSTICFICAFVAAAGATLTDIFLPRGPVELPPALTTEESTKPASYSTF